MSHQQPGPIATKLMDRFQPALPFVTSRIRSAQDHLHRAFQERRPLVVLDRGWVSGSKFLIQRFLANAGKGITVVRVTESCLSAIDGARELVRGIGFEPKDMGIADLEAVFGKFLAFQQKRKRRTLVVFEETRSNSGWVRDCLGRLVCLESNSRFGLMVILSRQTNFSNLGSEAPLDLLAHMDTKYVTYTPFTPTETRQFIRWRIDAAPSADIGGVVDFNAVTLMHELCDGMPDAIENLCCASIALAEAEDRAPVTTDIVMRASRNIGQQLTSGTELAATNIPTLVSASCTKVVLKYKDITVCEKVFSGQSLSIGRGEENDLCINSRFVSRQHATIFRNGGETAVVDLDSKNGTFVNSRRISAQTVGDQDEITIGIHKIQIVEPKKAGRVSVNAMAINGSGRTRNPKLAPSAYSGTTGSRSGAGAISRNSRAKAD